MAESYIRDFNQSMVGKKTLIPLENNPEVFTPLTEKLTGNNTGYAFYDVFSLDRDLLGFIPRPANALIVTIPRPAYNSRRAQDEGFPKLYAGSGEDEPIHWFKQTIGHTCGFMALLHALSNTTMRESATQDSLLSRVLEKCIPLKTEPRAQVLYDSDEVEATHMSVARVGDTEAPAPEMDNSNHFITFVRGRDGNLYELEGGIPGPINRGKVMSDDMLAEDALEKGMKPFIDASGGHIDFSMLAMVLD